jgi:hypothetical protein
MRHKGIMVRKTMDPITGSDCILFDLVLLHTDRDFDAMERSVGRKVYRG